MYGEINPDYAAGYLLLAMIPMRMGTSCNFETNCVGDWQTHPRDGACGSHIRDAFSISGPVGLYSLISQNHSGAPIRFGLTALLTKTQCLIRFNYPKQVMQISIPIWLRILRDKCQSSHLQDKKPNNTSNAVRRKGLIYRYDEA